MHFPASILLTLLPLLPSTLSTPVASSDNWYPLNPTESAYCSKPENNANCISAMNDAIAARDATYANFGNPPTDAATANAFRHCYWSTRMTTTFGDNGALAGLFCEMHEGSDDGESEAEKAAARGSCRYGRRCGWSGPEVDCCLQLAKEGKLPIA